VCVAAWPYTSSLSRVSSYHRFSSGYLISVVTEPSIGAETTVWRHEQAQAQAS
jgi:hypothetical protein